MPTIQFKAKIENVTFVDGSFCDVRVKVPAIRSIHCDMHAFRMHPRYGAYANSNLFPTLLKRALEGVGVQEYISLAAIPDAVTVDCSGFLAQVTIDV